MKKEITLAIAMIVLLVGCAVASQTKPTKTDDPPKKVEQSQDKVSKRIAALDEAIKVAGKKVEALDLWKRRVDLMKHVQDVNKKIMATEEWKTLNKLQMEQRYLKNLK